jgi:hypothetical protein
MLLRHLGVFLLVLVVAFIVAEVMPIWVDSRDVYLCGLFLFLIYLAISYIRWRRNA